MIILHCTKIKLHEMLTLLTRCVHKGLQKRDIFARQIIGISFGNIAVTFCLSIVFRFICKILITDVIYV